jgi:hypothetical protein
MATTWDIANQQHSSQKPGYFNLIEPNWWQSISSGSLSSRFTKIYRTLRTQESTPLYSAFEDEVIDYDFRFPEKQHLPGFWLVSLTTLEDTVPVSPVPALRRPSLSHITSCGISRSRAGEECKTSFPVDKECC